MALVWKFNYWQCSNTESVRVGRFLKLLIRGSCVSLSVCLSVCLSVYKNAIFITRRHRKMSQIYVKYSLYIQSYYFNFTFARASLWRVQLWNQWCTDRIWITAIYKNQCVLDILFTIREFLFWYSVWYSVFNNALPVEHRGSSSFTISNCYFITYSSYGFLVSLSAPT